MRERIMPASFDTQPSKYAGQEPRFKNREVMQTTSGERIIIVDYIKNEGLYVVANIDGAGVASPVYKISPDRLVEPAKDTQ